METSVLFLPWDFLVEGAKLPSTWPSLYWQFPYTGDGSDTAHAFILSLSTSMWDGWITERTSLAAVGETSVPKFP